MNKRTSTVREGGACPVARLARDSIHVSVAQTRVRTVPDQYREHCGPNGHAESPSPTRLEAHRQFVARSRWARYW